MSMCLVSMSFYYFKVANQTLQCLFNKFEPVEFDSSSNRGDTGEHCMLLHPDHGPALLKLIIFACVATLPTINALLSNFTSLCIITNPLNTLVFMLALPTYTAFFSAYAISRYADLTWGQRPTIDEQSASAPEHLPKCSRCTQPRAQGHFEYCEDHFWLYKKVTLTERAAYLLMIVNVVAIAVSSYVSPTFLVVVIYIAGAVQQTLAFIRTVGKLAKRFCRAICGGTTTKTTNYVKLTQEDPDLLSKEFEQHKLGSKSKWNIEQV